MTLSTNNELSSYESAIFNCIYWYWHLYTYKPLQTILNVQNKSKEVMLYKSGLRTNSLSQANSMGS